MVVVTDHGKAIMNSNGLIDTHAHMIPNVFRSYMRENNIEGAGGSPFPDWSPEAAIAITDERSIATAILSVSAPGVHLGDDASARRAARAVNEAAAKIVRDRPDRFGFFATLTLPDVNGAIAEAAYALDTLQADGVILLANASGRYLGDPDFVPLFAELAKCSAVVFVHPTELPGPSVPGIPSFAADFLLDTTRAALSLAASGVIDRYSRLRIILSHAGGFLPYAAYRMAVVAGPTDTPMPTRFALGLATLKRFYFDVALSSSRVALPSLLAFAEPDHVTYDSDWPWAPTEAVDQFAGELQRYPLADLQRASIERGTAEQLFPRFRVRNAG